MAIVGEGEGAREEEVSALITSALPVEGELSASGLFNWFLWNRRIDYLGAPGPNGRDTPAVMHTPS